MRAIAAIKPLIVDESDGELNAFVRARERGYTGISSKTCKGLYRSLLNAARCVAWNAEIGAARYFMSGEDLTTQAGLSVQQDLALANLLGITHVERNGHHYVDGMAALAESEQRLFLTAHPDLYEHSHGAVRLRIRDGRIALASLDCAGYASARAARLRHDACAGERRPHSPELNDDGHATTRHHHERRHRAHGHEPAPDPLDHGDPRCRAACTLGNGDRVMPDPILIGRNAEKIAALAQAHGIARAGHRPRQGAGQPRRHGVLRCSHHADAPAPC